MKRSLIYTLIISIVYLIFGNITAIAGMHAPSNDLLNSAWVEGLFAPYTFIAGLSEFAGGDSLSLILEAMTFFFSVLFFSWF